jgi:hypothetical protein
LDIVWLSHTLFGWAIHCPAEPYIVKLGHILSGWRSLETQTTSQTLSGSSRTLSGRRFLETRFSPKIHPFLSNLDS